MPVLARLSQLTAAVVALALGVALLAGCGVQHQEDPGVAARAAKPSAQQLLVSAQDLPDGFRDSGGQAAGYRQSVCGVDLEPSAPVQSADARFSQGPLGPFVEQRVRVYDDDSATAVLARLRTALAACDGYRLPATPSAPAVRMSVEPLALPQLGEESVAWRQTPDTELPVTTDVVLIRSGRTVVLVTSYSLKTAPPPATAEQVATAAADRLRG